MESNALKKIQSTLTRWAEYGSMTWLTLISWAEYGKLTRLALITWDNYGLLENDRP